MTAPDTNLCSGGEHDLTVGAPDLAAENLRLRAGLKRLSTAIDEALGDDEGAVMWVEFIETLLAEEQP